MSGETIIIVYHISKKFGQSKLPGHPIIDTSNIEYLIRENGYITAFDPDIDNEIYLHPHDIVEVTVITGDQ